MPLKTFYPVSTSGIPRFADLGGHSTADMPLGTFAVHLRGSHLSRYVNAKYADTFPAESFVNKVCHDDW